MTKGPARGSRAGLFLSPMILASWCPLNVLEKLARARDQGAKTSRSSSSGLTRGSMFFNCLTMGKWILASRARMTGRRGTASHQRRAEANPSISQGKAPDRRRIRVVYCGVARSLKPPTDLTTRQRRACGRGRRRRVCIWGRGGRRGCRISAPCRVRRGAHRPVLGWPRIPPGCHPARWRG